MSYRPTVLIVDDIEGNRFIIRKILGGLYRTIEASNGWEAFKIALEEVPDLILMDIVMPEMDGITAIRRLQENEKTHRIPILVITAVSDTSKRLAALESGAMDFITKPFDRLELLAHAASYTRVSMLNRDYILATLNPRTGLPNVKALEGDLEKAKAPKLFVLKIDNIDSITRFYGNKISTSIDLRIAEILPRFLSQKLSLETKIYSLAEATFGVLLDDPDGVMGGNGVRRTCEILWETLRKQRFCFDENDFTVEVTIGVSMGEGDVLQKAMMALDSAILNKVRWFVAEDILPDMHREIENNLFWLGKIRSALQNDLFTPHFQPILNNRTGIIDKFESLVRIMNVDGSVITPDLFLPVAKRSKYYQELTRVMVSKTFKIFAHRRENVSINLSMMDIENDETREYILGMISAHPEVSRRLLLELVEEEGNKGFDMVWKFIEAVKPSGVRIAIDDFGSGYSNFIRLLELKIDFLKLDGSLVRKILTDSSCHRFVGLMAEMARHSGMLTVAEYVETKEIQDELVALGVDYSQGFHIGKPTPLD